MSLLRTLHEGPYSPIASSACAGMKTHLFLRPWLADAMLWHCEKWVSEDIHRAADPGSSARVWEMCGHILYMGLLEIVGLPICP